MADKKIEHHQHFHEGSEPEVILFTDSSGKSIQLSSSQKTMDELIKIARKFIPLETKDKTKPGYT